MAEKKKGSELTERTLTEMTGNEFIIIGYLGKSYRLPISTLKSFIGAIGSGDTVDLTNVASNITPYADNTYNIGSESKLWATIFAKMLSVGGTTFAVDADGVLVIDAIVKAKDKSGTASSRVMTYEDMGAYALKTALNGYITSSDLDTKLDAYVTSSALTNTLKEYYTSSYVDYLMQSTKSSLQSQIDKKQPTGDYALKSDVDSAVDNILGGASGAYDTLKEIETLLKESDTEIDALLTEIGTKAPKAGYTVSNIIGANSNGEISSTGYPISLLANLQGVDSNIQTQIDSTNERIDTLTQGNLANGTYHFKKSIKTSEEAYVNNQSGSFTGSLSGTGIVFSEAGHCFVLLLNYDSFLHNVAVNGYKAWTGSEVYNTYTYDTDGSIATVKAREDTLFYNEAVGLQRVKDTTLKTIASIGDVPASFVDAYTKAETEGLYQKKITDTNKLAYSLIDGTPILAAVATSGSYNDLADKPTIPSAITEATVSGWGFTKNAGTITGIKVNGESKGDSGVVDLGTVITAHQTIHSLTIKNHDESYSLAYTPNSSSLAVTIGKSWVGLGNVLNVASYSKSEVDVLFKSLRNDIAAEYLAVEGHTANRVIISNGSGNITLSSITTTQLGYLANVTSDLQTQIDAISIPDLSGLVTKEELTNSLSSLSSTYLSFRGGGTVSGATIFSGGLSVQNSLTLLGVNVAAGSSGLTFGGKIPLYSGDAYTKSEADKEFHPLTIVDTAPTLNSSNLVTSGGVAKAVADLAESADALYQRKGSYLTSSSTLSSAKLDKNSITIAETAVSLGGSISTNTLASKLNLSQFLTGITSSMVTTALGYTPYNAANFTKANIKSTLGISDWALASSKPTYTASEVGALPKMTIDTTPTSSSSNLITSGGVFKMVADLDTSISSGYLLKTTAASTYLPLSGGALKSSALEVLSIKTTNSIQYPGIGFYNGDTRIGVLRLTGDKTAAIYDGSFNTAVNIITSGNIGSQSVLNSSQLGGHDSSKYMRTSRTYSNSNSNSNADDITDLGLCFNATGNGSGNSNFPYFYGLMLNMPWIPGDGNYRAQMHFGSDGNIAWRMFFDSANTKSWRTIIDSDNISSYAITSATLDDFPRLNGTSPSGASATGTWGISISGSATKLSTPRTIWGQSFDGSGDVSGKITGASWVEGSEYGVGNASFGLGPSYSGLGIYTPSGNMYHRIGTNTVMLINSSGNVTIGSSDLAGTNIKLRVNGNAAFGTGSDGGCDVYFTRNDTNYLHAGTSTSDSKASLAFTVGGGGSTKTALKLKSDTTALFEGNVGIGTDDPSDKLNVRGDIGMLGKVISLAGDVSGENTNANSPKLWLGAMKYSDGFYTGSYIQALGGYGYGSHTLSFFTKGTDDYTTAPAERMRITPSGNVGIGTTNPNTKLHVVGGAKIEGALSTYGITATTTAATDAAFTHYVGSTKLWWVSSYNNCASFNTALYVQSGSSPIKVATVNDLSSYLLKAGDTISGSLTFSSTSGSHIIGNANNVLQLQPGTGSNPVLPIKIAKLSSGRHTIYCDEDQAYDLGTSSYSYYYVYSRYSSASSDATKKNIIGNIPLTTAQIANAPAVSFTWKDSGEKSHGTIAQYWKEILPEFVSGEDGSYGLNYAALGVVSSIILARNIETHEQRIARLEKEISDLQKELNTLVNNE